MIQTFTELLIFASIKNCSSFGVMPLSKALANTSILGMTSSYFGLTLDTSAKVLTVSGKRIFNLSLMTSFSSLKRTFVPAAASTAAVAAGSSELSLGSLFGRYLGTSRSISGSKDSNPPSLFSFSLVI